MLIIDANNVKRLVKFILISKSQKCINNININNNNQVSDMIRSE
jgi:hypothetical protein